MILNERAEIRAEVVAGLFGNCTVARHDAAHIHDHLDAGLVPSVVLMNPPFSAVAHADRTMKDTALRPIRSALPRLAPGGRPGAITGARVEPANTAWTADFARFQGAGTTLSSGE